MLYLYHQETEIKKRKVGYKMNLVQPIKDRKKLDELKAELKAMGDKYYIMAVIGFNTGLRISDILNLKAKDFEGDLIQITETKTKKAKVFPINNYLRNVINTYIQEHNLQDDDYLIYSREGINKPIGRVRAYQVLKEASIKVGIDNMGTHTLRKTFGYHYYKKTHDIALLQQIFNHSSQSITLRYIGLDTEEITKSLNDFVL